MATILSLDGPAMSMVYDDKWTALVEALHGEDYDAPRVTDVERVGNEWVATHRETGTIISRGKNRQEVISDEVRWLEARM